MKRHKNQDPPKTPLQSHTSDIYPANGYLPFIPKTTLTGADARKIKEILKKRD